MIFSGHIPWRSRLITVTKLIFGIAIAIGGIELDDRTGPSRAMLWPLAPTGESLWSGLIAQSPILPRSPAVAPLRSAAPETIYTLGPGDSLQIDLFQLPQYSGEQEVQVDGSLNLPLVGRVAVGGLTLDQAAAVLSEAYSDVLRRPLVSLNLVQRRPVNVGIAGEVIRPGSYALTTQNASFPTLTQLLETAGGITQTADLRQVQIRRQQSYGSQTITVDLWHLLETGDMGQNLALRDGDSVFIPAALVSLEEGALLANASFYPDANRPIDIAVVGEVFRPGPYTVRGGLTRTGDAGVPGNESGGGNNNNNANSRVTVTDAIRVAGGIKPMANIRQVQVNRVTRSGTAQVFSVDLWTMLQTGDLRQDAILQDGDTVFIPTAAEAPTPAVASQIAEASFAPNRISVNVVGEVDRSGVVEVPPNTPLNQAILAAGGFNNRAREDSVSLVRLNPDGTVTQRRIEIDFTQGTNEDSNPVMRNNDIVIVDKSGVASLGDTLGAVTRPLSSVLSIFAAPFRVIDLLDDDDD